MYHGTWYTVDKIKNLKNSFTFTLFTHVVHTLHWERSEAEGSEKQKRRQRMTRGKCQVVLGVEECRSAETGAGGEIGRIKTRLEIRKC